MGGNACRLERRQFFLMPTAQDRDLMLRIDGVIYQLDVKVSTYNPANNYWHAKNTWSVKDPVNPVSWSLMVTSLTGVRRLPHRTPTGLETLVQTTAFTPPLQAK